MQRNQMQNNLEIVHSQPAMLAEGPCWDPEKSQLYWVDISAGQIHCLNLQTNVKKNIDVGQKVGAIALKKSGGAIVAAEHGIYFLDLETEKLVFIADPEAHLPNNRFNDGKCDAYGRFWVGTMSVNGAEKEGSLYCIEHDLTIRKVLENVSISNGISWSPDSLILYHIDTPTRQVRAYDYQLETGEIHNARVVIQIPYSQGVPDGMTTDSEGMLWIAEWGGFRVSRWNPANGTLLDEIRLPVEQVTSCVFGGKDLEKLFITTAREGLCSDQISEQPLAGAVFSYKGQVKGLPVNKFGE
jgi:sugar lactone lactonase YvrE